MIQEKLEKLFVHLNFTLKFESPSFCFEKIRSGNIDYVCEQKLKIWAGSQNEKNTDFKVFKLENLAENRTRKFCQLEFLRSKGSQMKKILQMIDVYQCVS